MPERECPDCGGEVTDHNESQCCDCLWRDAPYRPPPPRIPVLGADEPDDGCALPS